MHAIASHSTMWMNERSVTFLSIRRAGNWMLCLKAFPLAWAWESVDVCMVSFVHQHSWRRVGRSLAVFAAFSCKTVIRSSVFCFCSQIWAQTHCVALSKRRGQIAYLKCFWLENRLKYFCQVTFTEGEVSGVTTASINEYSNHISIHSQGNNAGEIN